MADQNDDEEVFVGVLRRFWRRDMRSHAEILLPSGATRVVRGRVGARVALSLRDGEAAHDLEGELVTVTASLHPSVSLLALARARAPGEEARDEIDGMEARLEEARRDHEYAAALERRLARDVEALADGVDAAWTDACRVKGRARR